MNGALLFLLIVCLIWILSFIVRGGLSGLIKQRYPQEKLDSAPPVKPRDYWGRRCIKECRNEKGELHCVDGPAVEWENGEREWWQDGKYHRLDGPAREYMGNQSWWLNGKLHRDDGPAKTYHGTEYWFFHGRLHRAGGPACEYPGGSARWYWYGQLHRNNGPAIEEHFYHFGHLTSIRREWWQRGKRHREDGPAVETTDGVSEWWIWGCKLSNEQLYAWRKTGKIVNSEKYPEICFWRILAAEDPSYWDLGIDARLEESLKGLTERQLKNVRRRVEKWKAAHHEIKEDHRGENKG